MIQSFAPRNFKCFSDEDFRLSCLTLLTGINGSGKSSLIQALILAHQAAQGRPFVRLNGPYMLQLGQAVDVFNMTTQANDRRIELDFGIGHGERAKWVLTAEDEEALVLTVNESPAAQPGLTDGLSQHFIYLSAERTGPRDVSEKDSLPAENINIGAQGEFVAQVLNLFERKRVRDELCHPQTKNEAQKLLEKQVELWMRELVPRLDLTTRKFEGTNTVALRMKLSDETADWLRPTNMAFGVTYALPIVVAGLLAESGTLFIVENPEAHLHPSGQSKIGRFLSTLAASGVQVIVETHSDHVLNGIRLAAADEHALRPDQVVIHHFASGLPNQRRYMEIQLTANGGLTHWPPEFFDQSEKDLAQLVKARRRNSQ
jgi:predicted ATPase